jgi:hypothetical protein
VIGLTRTGEGDVRERAAAAVLKLREEGMGRGGSGPAHGKRKLGGVWREGTARVAGPISACHTMQGKTRGQVSWAGTGRPVWAWPGE